MWHNINVKNVTQNINFLLDQETEWKDRPRKWKSSLTYLNFSGYPPSQQKCTFRCSCAVPPESSRKTDLLGPLMWKLIDVEPDLVSVSLLLWGDAELSRLNLAWWGDLCLDRRSLDLLDDRSLDRVQLLRSLLYSFRVIVPTGVLAIKCVWWGGGAAKVCLKAALNSMNLTCSRSLSKRAIVLTGAILNHQEYYLW